MCRPGSVFGPQFDTGGLLILSLLCTQEQATSLRCVVGYVDGPYKFKILDLRNPRVKYLLF